MAHRHIILFAHGGRDPEWAHPLEAIRKHFVALSSGTPATLAFLEFMTPDLASAIADAVAQGADEIVIAPMFLAQAGHLKRQLPALITEQKAHHPRVSFSVLPAIGEQTEIVEAIAHSLARNVNPGVRS